MTPAPTLPPIPWQPISLIPLPEVFEDDSPHAWASWDAAVRAMEQRMKQEAA